MQPPNFNVGGSGMTRHRASRHTAAARLGYRPPKRMCTLGASAGSQPPAEAWRLVLHSLAELDLEGLQAPPVLCR